MTFLLRNLVLFHVLLLVLFLTWVHGGTRADHLQSVPWLTLLILSVLVALPPQRKGETLPESRRRVWRGVLRDPLLYIGLALTVLLALQWLNGGRDLAMNLAPGKAAFAPAPWPGLPFSISPQDSIQQLYWFPPVFLAVLAVRHGVTRVGKRRLLLYLVWGGALLSVFGWIQALSGTKALYWLTPLPAHFFASFGYDNHAGAFFTLLLAGNGGIWFQAVMDPEEDRWVNFLLIPLALNFAGAMGSTSRAAMVLSLALLTGGGIACLLAAWKRIQIGMRVKAIGYVVLGAVLAIGVWRAFPSTMRHELETVQSKTFYGDTIGARLLHYRSAWAMAEDHPFFGVGGWGYRQFVQFYVTPDELEIMVNGKGQANVHNDTLQFLAEHGFVGLGLLLAAVTVLLTPILRGAWRLLTAPAVVDWDNPHCPPLLRVPAIIYAILLGTLATVIHSMIDLPFRSPAILITWCLCLACAPAFLPRPANQPAGGAVGRADGSGPF